MTPASLHVRSRFQSCSRQLYCIWRKRYYRKNCTNMFWCRKNVFKELELQTHRLHILTDLLNSMRTNWTSSSTRIHSNSLVNWPHRRDALMIPSLIDITWWIRSINLVYWMKDTNSSALPSSSLWNKEWLSSNKQTTPWTKSELHPYKAMICIW